MKYFRESKVVVAETTGGVLSIARWATDALVPDLTVVLDIEPRAGLARRGELDRMESQPLDFHERVRAAFLGLAGAEPARYLIVDAEMEPDAIAAVVQGRCEALITHAS